MGRFGFRALSLFLVRAVISLLGFRLVGYEAVQALEPQ